MEPFDSSRHLPSEQENASKTEEWRQDNTASAQDNKTPFDDCHAVKKRKHKRIVGALSFFMAAAALLLLCVTVVYAFIRYRCGSFSDGDFDLVYAAIIIGTVLGGLSLLCAVITMFLRSHKKGLAISGLLLSLLCLLVCVGAIYAYHYVFGKMQQDETVKQLSDKELDVVIIEDGKVIRDKQPIKETISAEELERMAEGKTVNFERLTDESIPAEALAKMDKGRPEEASYLRNGAEQITNFLIFGRDRYGSSDSNILCSVDRVHKKIKMISIARDSYVLFPVWGSYNKLNYAYSLCSVQDAIRTVNYNYSLNVKDYIAVDFEEMQKLIDYIGGVDVVFGPEDTRYSNSHMNGKEALSYSRDRSDSDTFRTNRQRRVLTAAYEKVRKMSLAAYPSFVRGCFGMCTTSFTASELLSLCIEVTQGNYSIESYALLEYMDYWGGLIGKEQAFYVVYDLNRASDWIYRTVYEELYHSGYKNETYVRKDVK